MTHTHLLTAPLGVAAREPLATTPLRVAATDDAGRPVAWAIAHPALRVRGPVLDEDWREFVLAEPDLHAVHVGDVPVVLGVGRAAAEEGAARLGLRVRPRRADRPRWRGASPRTRALRG